MASGWGVRGSSHSPCVEPCPSTVKSASALAWWTPLAPSWQLTETLPHPSYSPPEALSVASSWLHPEHRQKLFQWWVAGLGPHCSLKNSQRSAAPGQGQLASVRIVPFAEWPLSRHWYKIWICINLVNATHPTLVRPRDPAPPNSHTTQGSFSCSALWAAGRQQQPSGYPVPFNKQP